MCVLNCLDFFSLSHQYVLITHDDARYLTFLGAINTLM